ncbi:hypothetical protein [Metallosphaera cuprina]|uniref:hypothetical protein n=1 Tax=Metallosphaera cuprina TaxID=1006005 RepID=UPI00064FA845|nr:hypothetical protein [Metallosphaera cuprina]
MRLGPKTLVAFVLYLISFTTYVITYETEALIPFSVISSFAFWIGVGLTIPTSFYYTTFVKVKKGLPYLLTMSTYLLFHVLLYGIFYNVILTEGLGQKILFYPFFSLGFGVAVPTSPPLFLYWVSTSPGFWTFIGPFESDTTPYSLFVGIILSLLLGANVVTLLKLRTLIKDVKKSLLTLTAIPTLAIVSGTSCCLSLPSIVLYVIGIASGSIYSILGIIASPIFFALSYYGLPLASVALLLVNLRDMNRWTRKIETYLAVKGRSS